MDEEREVRFHQQSEEQGALSSQRSEEQGAFSAQQSEERGALSSAERGERGVFAAAPGNYPRGAAETFSRSICFSSGSTVQSIITKHSVPPITLETGSARKTPSVPIWKAYGSR